MNDPRLARNVTLSCGHPESQAQLANDEQTAWCYMCADRVTVTLIPESEA
jgi:hypothetical protein